MAVYTTLALAQTEFGEDLVDDLADLDEDGGDDSAVVTQAIVHVSSEIDSIIGAEYPVPLADIADGTPTPPVIQTAATYLLIAHLLSPRSDLATQRNDYRKRGMDILTEIRDGERIIPGITPHGGADALADGFSYADNDGTTPMFAGYDEDGDDRMDGW